MTEENSKNDEAAEPAERESITLNIPLDPAHQRMDLALREELEGERMEVRDLLARQVAPEVEQALYGLMQEVKYGEE